MAFERYKHSSRNKLSINQVSVSSMGFNVPHGMFAIGASTRFDVFYDESSCQVALVEGMAYKPIMNRNTFTICCLTLIRNEKISRGRYRAEIRQNLIDGKDGIVIFTDDPV